nr:MAG TPA_asm: hypothetical protein [Caudoviricetes sp.]
MVTGRYRQNEPFRIIVMALSSSETLRTTG